MSVRTVPQEYLCPITHQVMLDPVQTPCGHIFDREALELWRERQGPERADRPTPCPMDRQEFTDVTPRPELKQRIYDFIKENPNLFPQFQEQSPEEVLAASQRARQIRRDAAAQQENIRRTFERNLADLANNPANFSGRNIWSNAYISGGRRHVTFYVPSQSASLFSSEMAQGSSLLMNSWVSEQPYIQIGVSTAYPFLSLRQRDGGYGLVKGSRQLDHDLTPNELVGLGLRPLDNDVPLQQAIADRSPTGYRLGWINTFILSDFYIPVSSDRLARDTAQALVLCASALMRGDVVL